MPLADCPIVPSDSGWPRCPIITISLPSRSIFDTSMCTLATSGQVASNTLSPLAAASATIFFDTPCAEKITVPPRGTWSSSSTNTAPLRRRFSTTNLLCTIWRRT